MIRLLACMMVMVLLASAVPLAVAPAGAQQAGIPCDDGDNELTKDELVNAIILYMLGEGAHTLDDMGDAAWVYAYWNGEPMTVTDSIERTETIYRPVERLICLGNYRTEAVKIIGAKDKIVGISTDILKYDYYYPELLDKPTVGTWSEPEPETIVSLHPDIVITSAHSGRVSQLEEKLEPFGITVLGLDFYKDHLLESEIEKLGNLLNKNDETREYLDWRRDYEDQTKSFMDGLTEDEKPRVFIEWGSGNTASSIKSYGKGSSGDYAITSAGGINICGELMEYPKVNSEWVLNETPDVIVKCVSTGPELEKWGWHNTEEPEKVMSNVIATRPGWDKMNAVQNNSFYVYSSEIAWGPDSLVRHAYFVKWFHPESELDIDPTDIYKEYLERFLSVEYPEDLIFAYPPPAS